MAGSPTSPLTYERFISDILAAELGRAVPGGRSRVTHNQHVTGASGHKHQIDVFAEVRVAGITFRIAVECKFYSHRVGVDDVLEFSSRLQDISAHKGIVVTTVGFQEGALHVARSRGIALVKVGKAARRTRTAPWETMLSSPSLLQQETPGEVFTRWLQEGAESPHSLARETRFLDRLDLRTQGLVSASSPERPAETAGDEWLITYAVAGRDAELVVNGDGLLAAVLLFRPARGDALSGHEQVLRELFPAPAGRE